MLRSLDPIRLHHENAPTASESKGLEIAADNREPRRRELKGEDDVKYILMMNGTKADFDWRSSW